MVIWGGLRAEENKRRYKAEEKKETYTHLNTEFQRIAQRDKKDFPSEQCTEIEDNNRMGKIRYLSRKLQKPGEHFMQRWTQ